jgi:hypothetical protein
VGQHEAGRTGPDDAHAGPLHAADATAGGSVERRGRGRGWR